MFLVLWGCGAQYVNFGGERARNNDFFCFSSEFGEPHGCEFLWKVSFCGEESLSFKRELQGEKEMALCVIVCV